MATQDLVKTVQDIYAAFGRQDIPFIVNAFADDAEFHEPPAGEAPFKGTYRGRDGVRKFLQGVADAVDVQAFEPREFFGQGDTVIALGYYRFRARRAKPTKPVGRWSGASGVARSPSLRSIRTLPLKPPLFAVPSSPES